jgi:hypothetical protein
MTPKHSSAVIVSALAANLLASAAPAVAAVTNEPEGYLRTVPHAHDVLKVRGDFRAGLYVGRVRTITPEGMSGFQDDPQWQTGLPKPAEPLTWDQISSVERSGNEALKGAFIGGAIVGSVGALLGYAFGISEDDEGDAVGAAVAYGFIGFGVGAGLGAAIGTPFHAWHRVYSRD